MNKDKDKDIKNSFNEKQMPVIDVPVLRRAAMDCLARREHSLHELTRKLQRKFPHCESGIIDGVVEQLRAENLQSDSRFAESYVRYRRDKGFGYRHIRASLVQRQVSQGTIDSVLYPDDGWLAVAAELVRKKLGPAQALAYGSREHRRLVRFLESRGFAQCEIRTCLESFLVSKRGPLDAGESNMPVPAADRV